MSTETVYLITDIEEYGKFISFCIENDVCVFRTYWDENEKGDRCYRIDWREKRCFYSSRRYFETNGFSVVTPVFVLDEYGHSYKMVKIKEDAR